MSSQRKTDSARANGAKSHGPITPEGKMRSAQNATTHGLLAACLLLDCEKRECFDELLQSHIDRFQPADEVEQGLIDDMCAARWRISRAWAIETQTLDAQVALEKGGGLPAMAAAFNTLATAPATALMHRYQARLQLMYQRAVRTLIMLRTIPLPDLPNEPNPTIEHPSTIGLPACRLTRIPPVSAPTATVSAKPTAPTPPAADPGPPPSPKEPGGAA
jgi:hypothetical protein